MVGRKAPLAAAVSASPAWCGSWPATAVAPPDRVGRRVRRAIQEGSRRRVEPRPEERARDGADQIATPSAAELAVHVPFISEPTPAFASGTGGS